MTDLTPDALATYTARYREIYNVDPFALHEPSMRAVVEMVKERMGAVCDAGLLARIAADGGEIAHLRTQLSAATARADRAAVEVYKRGETIAALSVKLEAVKAEGDLFSAQSEVHQDNFLRATATLATYRALIEKAVGALEPFAALTDALVDNGATVAIGLRDSHFLGAREALVELTASIGKGA